MSGRTAVDRRKVGGAAAIALSAALVIVEILFDPLSWLVRAGTAGSITEELFIARERWQSQGITDYSIHVEGFVPLSCLVNATLSVRGGELVAVEGFGLPGSGISQGFLIESREWDTPYCSYRELLVPEMFVRIENELDRIDWSQDALVVRFSPEYGQVTEYRYDCCYRSGLLNPACSDCDIWFTFSNFEPITD